MTSIKSYRFNYLFCLQVTALLLSTHFILPTNAAVLVIDKMWPVGSVINVVFLDGTARQQALVQNTAPLWLERANLRFKFYTKLDKAPRAQHIRISFSGTTGSRLGNHGDYFSQSPTMQLGKIAEPDLPHNWQVRYILHEFGHALGLEHEHLNPSWPFGDLALKQLYQNCLKEMNAYFESKQSLTRHCRSQNTTITARKVHSTIFDAQSIMTYPMTIQLKNNQTHVINTQFQLSILDKLAIEQWYGSAD